RLREEPGRLSQDHRRRARSMEAVTSQEGFRDDMRIGRSECLLQPALLRNSLQSQTGREAQPPVVAGEQFQDALERRLGAAMNEGLARAALHGLVGIVEEPRESRPDFQPTALRVASSRGRVKSEEMSGERADTRVSGL